MQFEYFIITNSNIFYCFKFYKNNENEWILNLQIMKSL